MLVDVVLMRQAGQKLPRDRVKAAAPVRGDLSIRIEPWRETWRPDKPREPTMIATLRSAAGDLFPPLREARINSRSAESFVLVGLEMASGSTEVDLPQAWWCRLIA